MNKKRHFKIKSRKNNLFGLMLIIIFCLSITFPAVLNASKHSILNLQVAMQKKITINIDNQSLKHILLEIQRLSGIGFGIEKTTGDKSLEQLSLHVKNVTVEQALTTLLTKTNYTFQIIDNIITILKKTDIKEAKKEGATQTKKIMVSGIVVDSDKKPIAGATVLVPGTPIGAITDEKGAFNFMTSPESHLEISYLGMITITYDKPLSENEIVVVKMISDAMAVDDVIITGIFTKAKESYTGAVTTVTAKDIKTFKGQNLLMTLRNIDPSLNVVSNNSLGSNPNSIPEINIRGNSSLPTSVKELNENAKAQLNTPLIIMDGFEIPIEKLMDFNDEEIENISILKDASATAIYGSRGANGVIVVTTRAPQEGKIKIFLQASLNIEMPDVSSYKLLNAKDKLEIERRGGIYDSDYGEASIVLDENYNKILADVQSGVNTDWISQPIRTGIGQKYNLRLEGGSSEFRWSTAVAYNQVNGAMKGSSKNTLNGVVTLSYQLKNLIFKNQTQIDSNKGTEGSYGKFSDYTKMNPYWKPKDENGQYYVKYNDLQNRWPYYFVGNPLYNANLNSKNESNYFEFINNFSLEWTIIESLKLNAKFGISHRNSNRDIFKSSHHTDYDKYGDNNTIPNNVDVFRKGSYKYSNGNSMKYDGNLTLNYNKLFADKHQVYFGADYSISSYDSYQYDFSVDGFSNDNFNFVSNANFYGKTKPSGSESVIRRIGLTANANYTYASRYFVDLSFRIDGASQFGTKDKFAPFWSSGLGWNLHREKFLTNHKVINNLRIRGSYGQTGSQQFSAYQAQTTYQYLTGRRYLMWGGATLKGLGNENLQWQKTSQLNGGVEVALWGNRISATADVYTKKTSNLLSKMNLPLYHGFDSYIDNVGEVQNNGFEIMLNGYLLRNLDRNIIWTLTSKLTYDVAKVTKLSDAIKKQNEEYLASSISNSSLLYEGYSQNSVYVVPSMGIDPSTGRELFVNRDGGVTYTWDYRDRVWGGVLSPKYRGNVASMFSYKNLSVNVSFGFHLGGSQYNQTVIDRVENANLKFNVDERVFSERWQKPGDVVLFKDLKDKSATKYSSRFVQKDNVFEMQSANVAYKFNGKWVTDTLRFSSITVGCNMSDIFYISSIKRERGLDYPFARRVSFNLAFLF